MNRLSVVSRRVIRWQGGVGVRHLSTQPPTSSQDLPKQSSTVIIGGGISGVSTLYHLGKAGVTDAVLLEKSELTAGCTWHAAGLTTYFHPGANLRTFHYKSLKLYERLEEETGVPTGLHTPGSIRLIEQNADRIDEAHHQMGRSQLWPAEQHLIGRDDIQKLHPLVDLDNIECGIYTVGDGHIDPTSITNSLAAGARAQGGKIFRHTPVQELGLLPDGKWEVTTEKGTIIADRVVNCAGLWADQLARKAGTYLPLTHIEHQYVITESLPEIESLEEDHGIAELPVLRDLVGSYYLRQEGKGVLVGPYEPADLMHLHSAWRERGAPPPDFGMDLFPGDLDRISDHVEHSMGRMPAAATAGIKSIVNGPVSWPPDGNPLIGPSHDLPNFWHFCGMSYGIAHGGGAGEYLVDWMTKGEPPYELGEADPCRYGEWASPMFTDAKVRETYGNNNIIHFPHEEFPAGRPSRLSGAYQQQKQRGAEFGFHNGWEQPNFFHPEGGRVESKPSYRHTTWHDVVKAECENVMNGVGILDATPFSKFKVTGPKAAEFLERMCANTMPQVGRCNLSHMISPSGRMVAELTITRFDENNFYLVSGSGAELHDLRWFRNYLREWELEKDVNVENVTGSMSVLAVAGPKSRELLQKLTLTDLSDDAFKFMRYANTHVGPAPCVAIRVSYTGELGWELHHPSEYTAGLYDALLEAGKDLGVVDFGAYALNSLRLEKGFRLLGSDMTKDHNALEAGVDRFLKFNKDVEWVGRSALLKIKEEGGPLSRAVTFTLTEETDCDAHGNEPVSINNEIVGFTTSGGYGHTINKSIALGYIQTSLAVPGTQVEIELLGKKRTAEVAKEPLVDTEPVRTRKAKKAAAEALAKQAAAGK